MKPRLAASSYLNTAPLIWSFVRGSRRQDVRLTEAVPSRCAELLARGEVEAALVPVIEYQRLSEIDLIPNTCIASRQRVRSVVLAAKHDELQRVRSVALDESSRTSAVLIKIIFREFIGIEPKWVTQAPSLKEMLEDNDAALIIGDPAMTFDREGLTVFDLASLWKKHTGKGFVFAMWMVRRDASESCRLIDFQAVRDEGLNRVEEIVDVYHKQLGLPRAELVTYLSENITFKMDDDLRSGLALYFDLAEKHQQISGLKPINWIAHSAER
ncbi:MAG TPA: menaquinone biosynthesis protein [Pyrinomonadaceae bacterium]